MKRRAFVTGLASVVAGCAASFAGVRPARATVGGPEALELLGWARDTGRVLLLRRRGGEGDRVGPELLALGTRGDELGRTRSLWAIMPEERVEPLRARLAALEPLAPDTLDLEALVLSRGSVPLGGLGADAPLIPELRMRLAAFERGRPALRSFAWVTAYARAEARVKAAFRFPGQALAVVIASYLGIPFELVYERDVAWLVPYR